MIKNILSFGENIPFSVTYAQNAPTLFHPNINPLSVSLGDLASLSLPWSHMALKTYHSYFLSKSLEINVQEIATANFRME